MTIDDIESPIYLKLLRNIGRIFNLRAIYLTPLSTVSKSKVVVVYSNEQKNSKTYKFLQKLNELISQSKSKARKSKKKLPNNDLPLKSNTSDTYSVEINVKGEAFTIVFEKENSRFDWQDHETELLDDLSKLFELNSANRSEDDLNNTRLELVTEKNNNLQLLDLQIQVPLANTLKLLNKIKPNIESVSVPKPSRYLKDKEVKDYFSRAISLLEMTKTNTETISEVLIGRHSETGSKAVQKLEIESWINNFIDNLNIKEADIYYGHTPQSFEKRSESVVIRKILVEKVLQATIVNATKFRKAELAEIHITTEINDVDLVVKVKDFGIGIPECEIHKIGEPFFRASNNYLEEGLGFEVSILSGMLKEYGGVINFESELNEFTEVTAKIPYI